MRRLVSFRALRFYAASTVLWMSACGTEATSEDPAATTAEATESWLDALPEANAATGITSDAMRSIEGTDEMRSAGQELYAQSCVPCHGPEGRGRIGTGPELRSDTFLAAASDDYLVRTIGRGRTGTTMPAWGRSMSRSEIESIVAYIRGWEDVEPAELDESPNEGDAEAGAQIFGDICSACHGQQGGGYQETANGTGIGRLGFLGDASNGFLRHIIINGKTDTAMRAFGRPDPAAVANLTNDQIENVIAHLRASAW